MSFTFLIKAFVSFHLFFNYKIINKGVMSEVKRNELKQNGLPFLKNKLLAILLFQFYSQKSLAQNNLSGRFRITFLIWCIFILKYQLSITNMSACTQYKAVLHKNFLISKRTKEYIRENISVIILGVFLIVVENFQPNNFISPFYMALAVAGYSRTVALTWVAERENRQKELQKIMGISSMMYLLAWLTYYLINGFLVSLVMMLIFGFGVATREEFAYAQGYGFINIVVIYYVYTISIVGFVLLISNLFTKAKTAAQGATFIQLVINFLYFLRFSEDISNNHTIMSILSVFPQMGFNMGVCSIAFIDQKGFPPPNFSYNDALLSLSLGGILFLVLALYLDQVWPNQMGTNKHPLFFLNCFRKRNPHNRDSLLNEEENQSNETSAKYEQPYYNKLEPIIKILNLNKSFGDKKVVTDMKMQFYPSEIFCLLGHNGAGKSTTINLLTGLLTPNKGKIQILGMDYDHDVEEIRKNIGLCLQYNVLYDDLTIQDHLRFYAKIKGMDSQKIQDNILQIIEECSLKNQAGKLAKNLSGGNKRKLCLANALIGDSKIIFLDEPSSGLDPNSRQGIWDIMKTIRSENRCIILTTHHLEEAEELSQRIGIMSEGKFIIVGDCEFIKQKFSVGYHIVLTFKGAGIDESMKECRNIIRQSINGAKEDEQTAAKTLKFVLPVNQIDKFGKVFQQLQQFAALSVKISNLEDAFIKIGQEEDQNANLPEIQNLVLPQSECSYSFGKQFKAVFIKKALSTFRSLSTVVSVILPAVFIFIGVIMVTQAITGPDEVLKWVRRYVMSYFMVWGFVFNTSSYCGSIVLERQKKFKYLSNVMGLRKMPYWTANYALDLIIFVLPLVVFFILIYSIGEKASFLTDITQYMVPLLLLFSLSFISYSYLFSFVFQKSSTAYRFFPFLNLIFFYILPQIPQFVDKEGAMAQYVMPALSPFIAFSNSFFTKEFLGEVEVEDIFRCKSLAFNYAALGVQAVVFAAATLFIENLRFNLKDKQRVDDQIEQDNNQQINRLSNHQGRPIQINHLYKKYPNGYVAIRDNSFSVEEGEIFGLLGPNGAGKSTTFNIATAALPKTSGTVKILDQDVNKGMMEIFSNVGVCPQYDALYDNLTTQEHLFYFARLKGLNEQEIQATVKYYYELMSLTPYIKVKAGVLSGGNKRKLCVSMAMLANPSIMFFDEPSSGVDPISRRYLWKSLSLSTKMKKASMVLTTHAMNEAQSLCSRIGILIKGKFVDIATPEQLKRKYGKGYRITVTAPVEKHDEIKEIVNSLFKNNVSLQQKFEQAEDLNPEILAFIVESNAFSYSKAYSVCQRTLLQKKQLIAKYSISESTLEEVFLYLSQMQPPPAEEQYKQPWQCLCWEWGATGCTLMI